jgi:hypothetical protein
MTRDSRDFDESLKEILDPGPAPSPRPRQHENGTFVGESTRGRRPVKKWVETLIRILGLLLAIALLFFFGFRIALY